MRWDWAARLCRGEGEGDWRGHDCSPRPGRSGTPFAAAGHNLTCWDHLMRVEHHKNSSERCSTRREKLTNQAARAVVGLRSADPRQAGPTLPE
ncbi:hypothetical protein NDU88_001432 [Pleurodeles waltl]|uniref:Uncharacterized protein n=1 Tax=Pleurodeles waltl TaxID=8319 RepID=A0AAV7THU2_PLEWA|nr:hypothetical protein NDU88_001432 [Pleurodeles waltl]